MNDQTSVLRELASRNKPARGKMRVISVTSGKGGVGKTNFTVNLALALAEYNLRVAILDGDLGFANVDVACGITARYTIEHLITGEKPIEEIIVQGPKGILILPGGSGVLELADLDRFKLMNVITNLGRLEAMADVLIIDTGAGLGQAVMNFLNASDDIIVLTTPEPTALTDAYGLLKAMRKAGKTPQVNVVINRVNSEEDARVTFERLQIAVQKFLKGSLNLMGWVYEDAMVSRAIMKQEPLGIAFPHSAAFRCIRWIAGSVSGIYLSPPRQSGGIRGLLKGLLRM